LLQVARISDPHNKANFEPLQQAQVVGNWWMLYRLEPYT
jgi:hypothetical protein